MTPEINLQIHKVGDRVFFVILDGAVTLLGYGRVLGWVVSSNNECRIRQTYTIEQYTVNAEDVYGTAEQALAKLMEVGK